MYHPRTIGILGGGIAGLASAYYLARRAIPNLRILLLERSSRFGGWISSNQLGPTYNNHLFEVGPRTLRLQSGIGSLNSYTAVNSLKLLEELNLMSEQFCPIEKTSPANRNRLIYLNDQLINLNDLSLIWGGKPLKYPPIVYFLYEYFSEKGRYNVQDETIKSFIYRRFGSVLSEEIVEYLLDPVMKGIYAGDVSKLSARTVLKKIFDLEQRYGSIIAGLLKTRKKKESKHDLFQDLNFDEYSSLLNQHSIYYFRDGMEVLVKRLVQVLETFPNVQLIRNQTMQNLRFDDQGVHLKTRSNDEYHLDHLISAVPAFEFAHLLEANRYPILRSRLNQIAFVDMIVINLLYKKEDIYPKEAFGYLIPSREHSRLLGVLFDSCVRQKIDGQKRGSQLTVMMGGRWYDQWRLAECSDEQLMKFVKAELKKQIQLDAEPWHYSISRLQGAIPVGRRMRVIQHSMSSVFFRITMWVMKMFWMISMRSFAKNVCR